LVGLAVLAAAAALPGRAGAPGALERRTYEVDGVTREALVRPASGGKAPLVFFFHGHGGTGRGAARSYAIHERWPEATVVYPQGLPGPGGGRVDPEGKRPGWQVRRGDQGDRDLRFVDAMLADLKARPGYDAARVYSMGHSNGSAFTALLWEARGDQFAALCLSAAQGGLGLRFCKPKPVFQIAGEQDAIVPFVGQKRGIDFVHGLLKCRPDSVRKDGLAVYEEGENGVRHATYIHPGGHAWPRESLAPAVAFLKQQRLGSAGTD